MEAGVVGLVGGVVFDNDMIEIELGIVGVDGGAEGVVGAAATEGKVAEGGGGIIGEGEETAVITRI